MLGSAASFLFKLRPENRAVIFYWGLIKNQNTDRRTEKEPRLEYRGSFHVLLFLQVDE